MFDPPPPSLTIHGKPALLIIDMQNSFCHPGGLMSRFTSCLPLNILPPLVSNIQLLRRTFHTKNLPVIFITMTWKEDFSDSGILLDGAGGEDMKKAGVCVQGSWDAEILDAFLPLSDREREMVVEKTRHSAFWSLENSDFETLLHELNVRTCIVTGVSTDICVEGTVRDGCAYGFWMVTVKDAVGCRGEGEQRAAEERLRWFGDVMGTEEVLRMVGEWADGEERKVRREDERLKAMKLEREKFRVWQRGFWAVK